MAPLKDAPLRQEADRPRSMRTKSVDLSRYHAFSAAPTPMSKRASVDLGRPMASGSSPTFLRSPTLDFARPIIGQRQALPTPEELVQERAFRKWLNARLESKGFEPMANLATDLSDGVNLLRILEIVSTESLGRWNPNPRIRVQRAENLDIALKFIAAKGIVLTNISAEDILDSNLKLILGLVWTLLFRFSVQSLAADGINAKDALLIWVQEKIDAYDVPCEDWSRSFADGRVLCALLHAHKPTSFDWKEVEQLDDAGRVAMAFDIAASAFRVPRSLEVRDLCRTRQDPRPDEKVVMTYVASLYEAFQATALAETSAETLTTFVDQVDGVWSGQSEYEARASELLNIIAAVRALWAKEPAMPTYEDAAKKLARCRDPAPRRRLRDARRDLVSLHARVTAKIATYGLAPWRLPGHLAPSAITAELQGFFREEDARRESLATAVLRFQAEARRELALRCAAALDALDGLAQRIDALSLSDLERYIRKLEACKADLSQVEADLEAVREAEAHCQATGADVLHATMNGAADLECERDRLAVMLDERAAFARTQMSARRKGGELTPAELERLNTAWRHATATDRLSRSALVSVLSEIGLDLSDRDIDGAFAGKDALAHDDLLLLYKRHRGPSNVKRAFQALTGADLALDYTVLPRATAERLVKLAPTESKVEAVLRRAYG